MKKRLFVFMLSLILLLFPIGAFTACDQGSNDEEVAEAFEYALSEDGYTYAVVGIGTVKGAHIAIPSEYNGVAVTEIGDYAFQNCFFSSVTIPKSVKRIGEGAFEGCQNLESIVIPASVTRLGKGAFRNAYRLVSVSGLWGVTEIADETFFGCSRLVSVTVCGDITSIGSGAFKNCPKLALVTVPDTVKEIGASAFSNCQSLTCINIPEGVTSIAASTFANCKSLTSVTLPATVTSIGGSAFYACEGLTSINIPEGVTSIGKYTFMKCKSLKSLSFPEGITCIAENAFVGCLSLESLSFPSTMTSLGQLYGGEWIAYPHLASITVAEGNPVYQGAGNCLIETESRTLLLGCKNSVIPRDGSVVTIGTYAFAWRYGLTEIEIPTTVRVINGGAFYHCPDLTSIIYDWTGNGWKAITKAYNWDEGVDSYTIYCTDGEITK